MNETEFSLRCNAATAECAGSSPEVRLRVALCNAKLQSMRQTYACLMKLQPEQMRAVTRAALRSDISDGYAVRHVNGLGMAFYKYKQ